MLEIDISGNVQVMLSMAEITAEGSFRYLTEKMVNLNLIINAHIIIDHVQFRTKGTFSMLLYIMSQQQEQNLLIQVSRKMQTSVP